MDLGSSAPGKGPGNLPVVLWLCRPWRKVAQWCA